MAHCDGIVLISSVLPWRSCGVSLEGSTFAEKVSVTLSSLRRHLDSAGLTDVEVGTVDKFQGRQAPVVFVSMTASSADDVVPDGARVAAAPLAR